MLENNSGMDGSHFHVEPSKLNTAGKEGKQEIVQTETSSDFSKETSSERLKVEERKKEISQKLSRINNPNYDERKLQERWNSLDPEGKIRGSRPELYSKLQVSFKDFPRGLQTRVLPIINELLNDEANDKVILRVVEHTKEMILASLRDNRPYINMYGREYGVSVIQSLIGDVIFGATNISPEGIVRINADLMGLKACNTFGHKLGDQLLTTAAEIYKDGPTTTALKELGINVLPTIEGGDEYAMLIYGEYDLDKILPLLEELYTRDFSEKNVASLLDFHGNPHVKKFLQDMGVDVKPEHKFELRASIGSYSLSRILHAYNRNLPRSGILSTLMGGMYEMADLNEVNNKEKVRKILSVENPPMYALLNIREAPLLKRIREVEEENRVLKNQQQAQQERYGRKPPFTKAPGDTDISNKKIF